MQILSGMLLSFYYTATYFYSFDYVEWIMRDTYLGFFARYIHSNGASFFFFCIYIHFFRSLYYFSYLRPKLLVWNIGVVLLILMIVAAFTGYVLPWGQMSFWAATVITNLVTVIPFIGQEIAHFIWGSFSVSGITLNRFYTAHFFIPFFILFIMFAHFIYLHEIGSNNNLFIENTGDKAPFHPFYTWKDFFVVLFMSSIYFFIIWYVPNHLAHTDNYIEADPLVTPMHIVPEWYFLAYYAILRSIPHKLAGVIFMIGSLAILLIFPYMIKFWYKPSVWASQKDELFDPKVAYTFFLIGKRFNPFVQTILFWIFFINFIGLSYLGMMPVEKPYDSWGLFLTINYFGFFFFSFYLHSFYYWLEYWQMNDSRYAGMYAIILTIYKMIEKIFIKQKLRLYNSRGWPVTKYAPSEKERKERKERKRQEMEINNILCKHFLGRESEEYVKYKNLVKDQAISDQEFFDKIYSSKKNKDKFFEIDKDESCELKKVTRQKVASGYIVGENINSREYKEAVESSKKQQLTESENIV